MHSVQKINEYIYYIIYICVCICIYIFEVLQHSLWAVFVFIWSNVAQMSMQILDMLYLELLLFLEVQCVWQSPSVSSWLRLQIIWSSCLLSCLFFLYQRYSFPSNILCATPSNTMYIIYLSFHRLLVMLLMKGFMKNKLDWGVFLYLNQDQSTKCGKWLPKRLVGIKRSIYY